MIVDPDKLGGLVRIDLVALGLQREHAISKVIVQFVTN